MRIEQASEIHQESLIDLLREIHAHYNGGDLASREVVRDYLVMNLLVADSPHRLVLATRDDGLVTGLAAITLVHSFVDFSIDERNHCQLKELYVRSTERSKGIGRALMSWVARYAFEHGCRRIDWPVRASNARGISFYQRLGAEQVIERLSYRLSGTSLRQLAYASSSASFGR